MRRWRNCAQECAQTTTLPNRRLRPLGHRTATRSRSIRYGWNGTSPGENVLALVDNSEPGTGSRAKMGREIVEIAG